MKRAVWCLLFASLATIAAFPDTVTKTDHLSLNGSLTQMSDGVITLEAEFASDSKTPIIKTLHIPIGEVESIEFNDTTFNPGAPRKALGLTPPPPPSKQPAAAPDQLFLRGNRRQECKLIGIDQEFVHCAGKDGDYGRKITVRIQVGGH
jgi:hypothetical protein